MLSLPEKPMSLGDSMMHVRACLIILLAEYCCARPVTLHLVFGHVKGSVTLGRVTTSSYRSPANKHTASKANLLLQAF